MADENKPEETPVDESTQTGDVSQIEEGQTPPEDETQQGENEGEGEGTPETTPSDDQSGGGEQPEDTSDEPTPEEEEAIQEVSRVRQNTDQPIVVDAVGHLRKTDENIQQFRQNIAMNLPTEAQESFTKFFVGSKLLKSMGEGLDKITESMVSSIDGVVEGLKNVFGKKQDLYFLINYAQGRDYYSLQKNIKLFNPQGLKSKWLPYAQFLVNLSEDVVSIDKDVLYPLGEFLAKAINQPAILMNATSKNIVNIGKSEQQYSQTKKQIQKLFSGSQKEFVLWGEAFDRNTDVSAFMEKLQQAKSTIDKADPNAIKKQVDLISQRAKTLSDMLAQPTSGITLSQAQSKQMSELLMLAARYTELYTVAIQLIYELEHCVIASQQRIQDQQQ